MSNLGNLLVTLKFSCVIDNIVYCQITYANSHSITVNCKKYYVTITHVYKNGNQEYGVMYTMNVIPV